MNLVIQAHTLKNEPLSQPITGRFDERGGTIGRSDTNTLALPDPERHISRLHAEVWFSNDAFSIRNVGSANAILVNGRAIAPGEGTTLNDGDEVVVGAYAMRVTFNVPSQIRTIDRSFVDARTVIKSSAAESKTTPPHGRPPLSIPPTSSLSPPSPAPVPPPAAIPKAAAVPPASGSDPFADLFGGPTSVKPAGNDPFADLFGVPPPSQPMPVYQTPPAPVPPPPSPAAPVFSPAPEPAPSRLPDDFDPFADLAPPKAAGASGLDAFMTGSATPAPAAPGKVDSAFSDLFGSASPTPSSSLDDAFGLGGNAPAGKDPLADFLAPAKGSGQAPASTDPLAMFGTPSAPAAPAIPSDFDHTPELKGAYRPPAVQAPVPPPPPPPPPPATARVQGPRPMPPAPPPRPFSAPDGAAPPRMAPFKPEPAETTMPAMRVTRPIPGDDPLVSAPVPLQPRPTAPAPLAAPVPPAAQVPAPAGGASNATADALWAAFCEGAGVSMNLPQGLNPDLMRVIGQVMKHSVEGTLKLVAVRAAAKSELRAQVTTIQSRNNNPLKFSPDAASAIEQLLQPPMRGFMVGPQAVNDAMDDLLGHAIGTMAGMRAALSGVLERFEPAQLEAKLGGGGMMDALLPMNRRAKLWELYLQHFKRIEGDAQEDFHELFGKAFVRAYEDQLDRLDSARHPNV